MPAQKKETEVIFCHLDLGIGGAEQLVLQLATASLDGVLLDNNKSRLQLVTTRCDADHCFDAVQPGHSLHACLRVRGAWIPSRLTPFGGGHALCSTIRMLYLAWSIARDVQTSQDDSDYLIVLDVLPTPLPLLQWLVPQQAALLYYCHFPDQLLVQQPSSQSQRVTLLRNIKSLLRHCYRGTVNRLEAWSMPFADQITVNSRFTRSVVVDVFDDLVPRLEKQRRRCGKEVDDDTRLDELLPILYPALDTSALDEYDDDSCIDANTFTVVSLNRYERKKNIALLLQTVAWMRDHVGTEPSSRVVDVIIAGGYDPRNQENVEHKTELESLADELNLPIVEGGDTSSKSDASAPLQITVRFECSISNARRTQLLTTASACVYTPDGEHFGIVPLEAMYAGTPVLASNVRGGPLETVRHNETGALAEPTPEGFGRVLLEWWRNPEGAADMGQAGRQHVIRTFGHDRLTREWSQVVRQTLEIARQRRQQSKWRGLPWWIVPVVVLAVLAVAALALYVLATVFTDLLLQLPSLRHQTPTISNEL